MSAAPPVKRLRDDGAPSDGASAAPVTSMSPPFRQFVMGRDVAPVPVDPAKFGDPFAKHILIPWHAKGAQPQSGAELFSAFQSSFPQVRTFLVGDGFHFPADTNVDRDLRFIVTARESVDQDTDTVLAVFDVECTSTTSFLQVLSWDSTAGHFNWYFRNNSSKVASAKSGEWLFNGNSWDAFEDDSRGKGPFDGHVNGSVVMKERMSPWLHWFSQRDGDDLKALPTTAVARTTLLNSSGTFELSQANDLQSVIEALADKWNTSRVEIGLVPHAKGASTKAHKMAMLQILKTTTIELASAEPIEAMDGTSTGTAGTPGTNSSGSAQSEQQQVVLPFQALVDVDAMQNVMDAFPDVKPISIPVDVYHQAIQLLDVAQLGRKLERTSREIVFSSAGDAFFPLPTPVRAFDDASLVQKLAQRNVFTKRFLLCLLAVDFQNPVYSSMRAALMHHVPPVWTQSTLYEKTFVDSVTAAAANGGAPETEFMRWWSTGDALEAELGKEISSFFAAVGAQMQTVGGVVSFFEVIQTRRALFRTTALNEFRLTFPFALKSQTYLKQKRFFYSSTFNVEERA